jgi:hypothetical protein
MNVSRNRRWVIRFFLILAIVSFLLALVLLLQFEFKR